MKYYLSISLSLFTLIVQAQNWKVFNAAYRYNYKYDNSALISQVVFADSSITNAGSTIHYLNRIGVETSNTTYTYMVVVNMPQFLQRSVVEHNSGLIELRDTAKLVIKPTIGLNQTWLFDSINNISGTCIAANLKTLFGVTDSVKVLLVGTQDTLVLSKQFGIVMFPKLYAANKYYRLVGIENSNSYDSTALFGQKVLNAWDFYRFTAGDEFMHINREETTCLSNTVTCHAIFDTYGSLQISNGFVYSGATNYAFCNTNTASAVTTTTQVYSATWLSGKSFANTMYPGKVISSSFYSQPINLNTGGGFDVFNLVKFGTDALGNFMKYSGYNWGSLQNLSVVSNAAQKAGLQRLPSGIFIPHYQGYLSEFYIVGLGKVQSRMWQTCYQLDYYLETLKRNGELVLATEQINSNSLSPIEIFPMPFKNSITVQNIPQGQVQIELFTVDGKKVLSNQCASESAELSTEGLSSGIYLLVIKQNNLSLYTKKIAKSE